MKKYDVVRTLGRGSYGKVDLGKSKENGEQYAIKKVKLGKMTPEDRTKALEEAKFLSKLDHPNIVSYKESFQESDSLYIVMEYMDGGDLEKKIAQRGHSHLTEQEIMFSFVQVLSALQYLHSAKKILHRDIKPQNCFLTRHGVVKLGDFGVARSLNNAGDLAKTVIGTPFYLAPEIWDNHPYSFAADVYSLGVVLYELCSLKKPFEADSAAELLIKVMKHEYTPIPSFFSKDLRSLIDSMMMKDPLKRPTCDDIIKMKFIQDAIQSLVDYNKSQFNEKHSVPKTVSPAKTNRSGVSALAGKKNLGRGRLLMANVINKAANSDDNDDNPTNDNNNSNDENVNEFEDDFIEDEDEEEEDEFLLLENVTMRLQQSIIRNGNGATVCKEPIDPFRAENLRERLLNQLGEAKLNKLIFSLKNIGKQECKDFVKTAENEDKTTVDEARELIKLES
ncbi:hypothetical protein M9Y10_033635 [Tritrichomonas musculus]|uniref:non-specific serine/threonine protein kinase n=1 Tax=Tritrichomonas musculus TaxID=1915356 RepID=A0ABR2KCP6_9EUKA